MTRASQALAAMTAAVPWMPITVAIALGLALLSDIGPSLPDVLDRIAIPYQTDPSEGVIVGETRLLLDGVDIYQPVRPDFFTAAPYPPLYYLLLAPLMAAGLPPFPAARALVAIATLLLAIIVGGIVAWRDRQPAAGLVAAGLWLAPNLVAVWVARARPDLLALTVNLLGLAAVWAAAGAATPAVRQPTRGQVTLLAGAAALFALGFYFKHTALAAPAAAGLFLLVRAPRAAVGLGVATAVAIAGPFLLLDWRTRGGFTQHLIAFHRSFLWQNYVDLAQPFILRYWPVLVLPVLALAVEMIVHRRPSLPSLYLLTAAVVSLGGGTHGGNHNHLLETLLASALAGGHALGRALPGRWAVPALLATLLACFSLLTEPATGRAWLAADVRPPSANERLGWQQVIPVVASDPGPVYSDNVGLLVITGHPVRYSDPFTLAGATKAGLWSDAALVAAIRERHFSLIALRYDVTRLRGVPTDITPDMIAALRESYVVADRNVMMLYRPRPGG